MVPTSVEMSSEQPPGRGDRTRPIWNGTDCLGSMLGKSAAVPEPDGLPRSRWIGLAFTGIIAVDPSGLLDDPD